MKFFKLLFLSLLFILLLISCNNKKSDEYVTIHLKPSNDKQYMSTFIEEIDYIKLKTPKGLSIGNILRVKIYEDLMFIRHSTSSPMISVFDKKGDFKYNIGKRGRGPGEYAHIHDYTINSKTKELIINDLMVQKAHYYNIDGTHIKSIDLPIHSLKFTYLNSNEYAFWVGGLYNDIMNVNEEKIFNVYITDEELNVKNSFLEIEDEFKGVTNGSGPSSLSLYKNGINIVSPLSYYIYNYTNGNFTTKYYMDFGALECNFKYELQRDKGIPSSFIFRLRKNGATYYLNQFFEFDNYIYFTFLSNDKMHSVIYDKNNEVPYVCISYPSDDINGAIFGKTVGRDGDNKLITTIEPALLADEDDKFPEKLDYLKLTLNSNPIVAIYKIK